MAHHIQLLVAAPPTLARLVTGRPDRSLIALPQSLAGFPVDDTFLDDACGGELGPVYDGFEYLGDTLDRLWRELSARSAVVYLETEYFGGLGGQRAAAYADGERLLLADEPLEQARDLGDGPINRALRVLGVQAGEASDEFDALELGNYRSLEDFEEIEEGA